MFNINMMFFLMIRRPPRSTRTYTLFPYTKLFRSVASAPVFTQKIEISINSRYLNFPVSHQQERGKMTFAVEGKPDLSVVIRLAPGEPDYWVFKDVRSEEHTSELQSLMRTSYAAFCSKTNTLTSLVLITQS